MGEVRLSHPYQEIPHSFARPLSALLTTSRAFARIENHYFVNKVSFIDVQSRRLVLKGSRASSLKMVI